MKSYSYNIHQFFNPPGKSARGSSTTTSFQSHLEAAMHGEELNSEKQAVNAYLPSRPSKLSLLAETASF